MFCYINCLKQLLHSTSTKCFRNYMNYVNLSSGTILNDNGYYSSYLNFQSGLDLLRIHHYLKKLP